VLHERWLERLESAFDEDDIMVVLGLVLPAELETQAKQMFEIPDGHFLPAHLAPEIGEQPGLPENRLSAAGACGARLRSPSAASTQAIRAVKIGLVATNGPYLRSVPAILEILTFDRMRGESLSDMATMTCTLRYVVNKQKEAFCLNLNRIRRTDIKFCSAQCRVPLL
jgi:hypothetical protein